MKIVILGSHGFIGSHLSSFFRKKGYELVLLSRHPVNNEQYWNPDRKQVDPYALENTNVVINLCGESIFGRWTEEKKTKIQTSRFIPTQFITETLARLEKPPELYIGASAVGYYGERGEEILTENDLPGDGFLSEVCKKWEEIPEKLPSFHIRTVCARFGIVLGKNGGALKKMKVPFKLGLGGKLGSGKQFMSWISIDDLLLAMQHVIEKKELQGPINFSSPQSVTNQVFTKTMGKVIKRPVFFNVPSFLIKMIMGESAETLLSSTRAFPQKLLESGFTFRYPDLESALKKIFAN